MFSTVTAGGTVGDWADGGGGGVPCPEQRLRLLRVCRGLCFPGLPGSGEQCGAK